MGTKFGDVGELVATRLLSEGSERASGFESQRLRQDRKGARMASGQLGKLVPVKRLRVRVSPFPPCLERWLNG